MHVGPQPAPSSLLRKGKQSFLWASVAAAVAGGGGQGRAEELKRQKGKNETIMFKGQSQQNQNH